MVSCDCEVTIRPLIVGYQTILLREVLQPTEENPTKPDKANLHMNRLPSM